jgi:hypothetical protein
VRVTANRRSPSKSAERGHSTPARVTAPRPPFLNSDDAALYYEGMALSARQLFALFELRKGDMHVDARWPGMGFRHVWSLDAHPAPTMRALATRGLAALVTDVANITAHGRAVAEVMRRRVAV